MVRCKLFSCRTLWKLFPRKTSKTITKRQLGTWIFSATLVSQEMYGESEARKPATLPNTQKIWSKRRTAWEGRNKLRTAWLKSTPCLRLKNCKGTSKRHGFSFEQILNSHYRKKQRRTFLNEAIIFESPPPLRYNSIYFGYNVKHLDLACCACFRTCVSLSKNQFTPDTTSKFGCRLLIQMGVSNYGI